MTMLEILQKENRPHGKICVGFTPDEEVGQGADLFDVEHFGAAMPTRWTVTKRAKSAMKTLTLPLLLYGTRLLGPSGQRKKRYEECAEHCH